jgi:hypothetical protein
MNEYQKQYVVPAIVVDEYHPELQKYLPDGIQEMAVLDVATYAGSVRTHELAKELGLHTFDTALPQPWVNHVVETTGFNPVGQVVWHYDEDPEGIWGGAVAVTREAKVALEIYDHITGER